MSIKNLQKIMAAKGMQMQQSNETKKDNKDEEEFSKLLFNYIEASDKKIMDILRVIQDNQKILDAKVNGIVKWIEDQDEA